VPPAAIPVEPARATDIAGAVSPGDPIPAIETVSLTRKFGRRAAVRDLTFQLHEGECLALFGPNGAGKTTLLRVLAGLLRPNGGTAKVSGVALPGGAAARSVVGLISHQSMLYAPLTALENVEFTAKLYGVPSPRDAAMRALERLRLADRAHSLVRSLSRGMQQRVSIARAIVHAPRVVLLDEPYTGLDEAGAAALSDALKALRSDGAALVLVTHHLSEGLALATHTAIMREGQFVRYETRGDVSVETYRDSYRDVVTE
jgi:heme exporter protein A